MVFQECGPICPITCHNHKDYDCQLTGCRQGCFCPRNKVLADNDTCVDVDDCNAVSATTAPSDRGRKNNCTMCVSKEFIMFRKVTVSNCQ